MSTIEMKVVFNDHFRNGMKPPMKWIQNRVHGKFVEFYNLYCVETNALIEELNEKWDEMHPEIEKMEDGSDEAYQYGRYLAKAFDDVCYMLNHDKRTKHMLLDGFIFMDGDIPVFGARSLLWPDWEMDFTLQPIE